MVALSLAGSRRRSGGTAAGGRPLTLRQRKHSNLSGLKNKYGMEPLGKALLPGLVPEQCAPDISFHGPADKRQPK